MASRGIMGGAALVAVALAALLGPIGHASAKAPTSGLVRASDSVAAAVVKAVNANTRPQRPASCFEVWVTKSSSQWATWTFSKSAGSRPACTLVDAYREFYSSSGGKWKWAGRFSGVESPLCFFAPKALPGLQVQRDLGCT
jgi:hypothetical protein